MGLLMCITVLSDPVGEAFSFPFYRRESWGSGSLFVLPPAPLSLKESIYRTPPRAEPTLTGAGRDPNGFTYETAMAPTPNAGKNQLGSGSLCLLTPQGGSAPSARTHTFSRAPNT